ncbi:MAG TPA: glutamate ABC transporter substrate-binding protein [Candidatus Limnocylindria bacterium]|nr:glutamate ABC transporter substrate-binding protein [Candidatus Limnocylindria bacterium]
MGSLARAITVGLGVAFTIAACGGAGTGGGGTATPTPQQTAAAKPTFDAQSFMYAIQVKGKIRIGTQENNPPFSVKSPVTSKWEGFDADIGRELAKGIFGASEDPEKYIEWVPVTSPTRIPTLTEGKADVIIKTFTITAERKTQIDFSDVYFQTGQRILVKKANDTIKEVADLNGKTFCAQRGTTSEQNVIKAAPQAKFFPAGSYPECLLALNQGSIDAVSTDETILFGLVQQDANTKIVGKYFSEEPYGIGVKKNEGGDRTGFVPFLNTWIGRIIQDGTWAKLYEKHITPVSGDKKTKPTG